MQLLLNLLWIFFGGGLVICFEYLLGGLLLCLTVVGIPFGLQCFKIAGLALTPFGKDLVEQKGSGGIGCVLNAIWLALAWVIVNALESMIIDAVPPPPKVFAFVARKVFEPTRSILTSSAATNEATPPTALRLKVPAREPVPVCLERLTVALLSAPVETTFPKASRISRSTRTSLPATVLTG